MSAVAFLAQIITVLGITAASVARAWIHRLERRDQIGVLTSLCRKALADAPPEQRAEILRALSRLGPDSSDQDRPA